LIIKFLMVFFWPEVEEGMAVVVVETMEAVAEVLVPVAVAGTTAIVLEEGAVTAAALAEGVVAGLVTAQGMVPGEVLDLITVFMNLAAALVGTQATVATRQAKGPMQTSGSVHGVVW
jgi:hypothetical protein